MARTNKGSAQSNTSTDPYFKKTVSLRQSGQSLTFRVSQDLFSSFDVDLGTKFLLRTLADIDVSSIQTILDLGCGYGPIGLTLKKVIGHATVHMVDRDALAVEYARQNAVLNDVAVPDIYGSLGYDDIRAHSFDLIVSNIPAKAGEAAIANFLLDAVHHLAAGGLVAVVVITPLEALVDRVLASDPHVSVVFKKARPGHTVFHYQFTERPNLQTTSAQRAFDQGAYSRELRQFPYKSSMFSIETAYGMSEFDTLSYDTELLVQSIASMARVGTEHAVMLNPRQGHAALALLASFKPQRISLVDRDLLALMYTQRNLVRNGFADQRITVSHQVGLSCDAVNKADVVSLMLREDEGQEVVAWLVEQGIQMLDRNGLMVIVGSSTAISRLSASLKDAKQIKIEDRKRRFGYSLLILRASS